MRSEPVFKTAPDEASGTTAPDRRAHRDHLLGAILIDAGKLDPHGAEQVLRLQRAEGLRFGDAAVRLGLVTRQDVERAVAQQFDYPYLGADDNRVGGEVVAAFSPFSRKVEELRSLRSQLMVRLPEKAGGCRMLAVVSPGRSEGRSFLAANLAVVFSQLGERTLLIDADLRNPRQHEIFRLKPDCGLAAALAGRADGDVVQQLPALLGLAVITAGFPPPNPQELLSRDGFAALLTEVAARFDVAILDTPALSLADDAQIAAARAGAAVLVARANRTRSKDLREAAARLAGVPSITVVGTVLSQS